MNQMNMFFLELANLNGTSAAQTTNFLKTIGNGYMVDGIKEIANKSYGYGLSKGRLEGIIIGGVLTAAIAVTFSIYEKRKNKAKQQIEDISQILREEFAEADNEKTYNEEENTDVELSAT